MGAPDSGATGQDDAQRLNGLMGTLGKRTQERDAALTRIAELEAQLQATGGQPANSQPDQDPAEIMWQSPDGKSARVRLPDGTIATYDSGTPIGINPSRGYDGNGRDDGSPQYAKSQLAKALGVSLPKTSWP